MRIARRIGSQDFAVPWERFVIVDGSESKELRSVCSCFCNPSILASIIHEGIPSNGESDRGTLPGCGWNNAGGVVISMPDDRKLAVIPMVLFFEGGSITRNRSVGSCRRFGFR
ncbi:uncharacterized protein [Physcomitrium patens]|uniref:uncharacterized protein isoform X2 n=1 Tax=Physcomitrium patens TaxID=3218 RepID=UPI003CCDEEED